MVEIWKDVVGYESIYEISNFGNVKSFKYGKEKIRKLRNDKDGYLLINLCKDKKVKTFKIHRLVAQAFIPNPDNKPQINHIDGNKSNNKVDNLEWVTNKENSKHAVEKLLRNTKGENHHNVKLRNYQVLNIRKKYATGKYKRKDIADEYQVSITLIGFIINRKIWKHI
jgi:hypothetical protein